MRHLDPHDDRAWRVGDKASRHVSLGPPSGERSLLRHFHHRFDEFRARSGECQITDNVRTSRSVLNFY